MIFLGDDMALLDGSWASNRPASKLIGRWKGKAKRSRIKSAPDGGILFEQLEPRVLLSADLNPLNSTALTALSVLPGSQTTGSNNPKITLSPPADTSILNTSHPTHTDTPATLP